MKTAAVLCVVFLCTDQPKSDRDLIQGTWEFVSFEVRGKELGVSKGMRIVIAADTFCVHTKDGAGATWKFKLDANQKPKQMDLIQKEPGKPVSSIYSIDGDDLKICLGAEGAPRPKKFGSNSGGQEGMGVAVWVFKREKKSE